MKKAKIKLLGTGEEVIVNNNMAIFPETFMRLSKSLLLGFRGMETKENEVGILSVFQLGNNGVYHYVATLDFKPLETKLPIEKLNIEKPMQVTVLAAIPRENSGIKWLIEYEDTQGGVPVMPHLIKQIFGLQSTF